MYKLLPNWRDLISPMSTIKLEKLETNKPYSLQEIKDIAGASISSVENMKLLVERMLPNIFVELKITKPEVLEEAVESESSDNSSEPIEVEEVKPVKKKKSK